MNTSQSSQARSEARIDQARVSELEVELAKKKALRKYVSAWNCESCGKLHTNEFSITCGDCDYLRESEDLEIEV